MSFDLKKAKKSGQTSKADRRAAWTAEKKAEKEEKLAAKKVKARVWSPQQEAIFKACHDTHDNLVVEALAGTGKTTTMIEATNYLSGTTLLCAFNKRVADELKAKIGENQHKHVSTLHALGLRLVKRLTPNVEVCDPPAERGLRLAAEALKVLGSPILSKSYLWAIKNTASTCKEVAPFLKVDGGGEESLKTVETIGYGYGHLEGIAPKHLELVCTAVLKAMELSLTTNDGMVDYSDMLYIPLHKSATRGEYDNVIVDEAQDMNRAQLEIAQRVMKEGGRIIVVGDRHQAIYGFRGADRGSMDRLAKAFEATTLPLNITYRCPKLVVQAAQALVPEFKAANSAPEGVETWATRGDILKSAQPGDFILSRLNAPLLGLCLELVNAGKRAKVEGRDIGQQLVGIIRKITYGNPSVPVLTLLQGLAAWENNAVTKAMALDDEDRIAAVQDQAYALKTLAEGVGTTGELERVIGTLFTDDAKGAGGIVCSTVHKAKGLESDRVFILADTFKGHWGPQEGSEEGNLKYVAITRSKQELVWVDRADAPRVKAPLLTSKHEDPCALGHE